MVDAGQRYRVKATGIVVKVINRINDHAFIQYPSGSARSIGIVQLLDNYELIEEENVTEFKVGDTIKHKAGTSYEILAMTKEWVILLGQQLGEEYAEEISCLKNYTKVEPFFEADKTYRSLNWCGTFDVHHVGYLGAKKDGRRYAAGQFNPDRNEKPHAWSRENFDNWTEV